MTFPPAAEMRPVRCPEHALRRRLNQRLGAEADVVEERRADLRHLVGGGELDVSASAFDEPEQHPEGRVIERHRFEELAHVIDDQRARQAPQKRLTFRQEPAVELQLHMPAERRDAGGERSEAFPREHTSGKHVEAHPADACAAELIKLRIGYALVKDGDATRVRKRRDRLKRTGIIGAVA